MRLPRQLGDPMTTKGEIATAGIVLIGIFSFLIGLALGSNKPDNKPEQIEVVKK